MLRGNKSTYYLQADEIDHLLLPYIDYRKPFDKAKAARLIKEYCCRYDGVESEIGCKFTPVGELNAKGEDELYSLLTKVRNILLS